MSISNDSHLKNGGAIEDGAIEDAVQI